MKAVKSDPDPEWGSAPAKSWGVFSPGSVLTAFLFSTPSRSPYVKYWGRKWGRSEGNRDTVRRKSRGQFPNNPCGWSNHQAGGIRYPIRSMMILFNRGEAPSPSLLHRRGVGGVFG